jgi:elongation factor 2
VETLRLTGTLLMNVKAYMPVNESTGFDKDLRKATSGKAYPQCVFDHWQTLPGDPFDGESTAGRVCQEIRRMKSLGVAMPKIADYLDKL